MSIALESVRRLNALKQSIEAKTGKTYTDLTEGVQALTDGCGTGGESSGGASGIYFAKITPEENISSITVKHDLGTTDILIAAMWLESFGDFAPTANYTTGRIWLKTDIPVRVTSSVNRENLEAHFTYNTTTANINSTGLITSEAYYSDIVDENNLKFYCGNSASARFYGGATYTVVIIPASAGEV